MYKSMSEIVGVFPHADEGKEMFVVFYDKPNDKMENHIEELISIATRTQSAELYLIPSSRFEFLAISTDWISKSDIQKTHSEVQRDVVREADKDDLNGRLIWRFKMDNLHIIEA